ncbi:MAG TPA: M15 family metallopeptidase, partial [Candidatus Limnocylindrales bacterium]|nr:M15 family metallopeptidase [Candidatus Limnocylindrales bacterium]
NAQLRSALNSAKGPLLAVMTTCAVKSFSDGIDSQNFENQQQLKRVAMDVQAMGAQVQSGDGFNAEELGAYAALNYDPKTGTSLLDDPHIKQEIGEPATGKSYVEDVMPGSKEKPGFFKAADKIPVVGGICTLIQEGAELPVIKQALQLSESGMNATFRLVGLSTPDEYVKRAQKYFTTGGVNLAAQGAERGGLVNIGTRMAVGDQMIAMAGRELTPAEERQVQAEAKEYQQGTFAQSSFYERYANIYNHQSVASGVLRHTPTTRSEAVASLTQLPRFAFSQTIKVFGLATVGAAEPKRYEYSFPMFGFSSAEKNDPLYENPYELEEYMLEGDRLTRMNTEYGQSCFGVTVAPDGKITYGESLDITKIADKCKDPSNTELVRYRFYIAYIITSHGMSCSEGAEDACQQLSGSAPAQNLSVPPGEVVDAFLPSDSIPCPPGTDDAGVHDGYREGNPIKIRLCGIPGLPSSSSESTAGTSFYIPGSKGNALVNSRIAANILKLVQDATAAGIPMRAASSFRTMAHQQSLCPCGNGRVAKPGFSNHQTGLALDFDLADGKSLSVDSYTTANGQPDGPNNPRVAPSSPVYKWLVQNASKYGLKQYYKEPWHWSVDGS